MLKQYLLTGLRNLLRQKALAIINIVGLSVGLACFCLFLLYALHEFSFDTFHERAGDIYRVNQWWAGNKDREARGDASVYTPLGPALKADLPDVAEFVRFQQGNENMVRVDGKTTRLRISFADPQIFTVFSFPLLRGDPSGALKDPGNIVLTREKAIQLFGSIEAVGKRIEIKMDDTYEPFIVGGIAADVPENSMLRFGVLGSFAYVAATAFGRESAENWNMTIGLETYVLLKPGSNLAHDHARLAQFRRKYYPGEEAEWIESGDWDGKGVFPSSFRLQALTDIHTDTTVESAPGTTVSAASIWILLAIASGVLLIACINFTTLAIGRSAGRAKEVGIRKLIGSGRRQLILQFLSESLLLSIFSGCVGLLLVALALPYFNQLAGVNMQFSFVGYPQLAWLLGLVIIVSGLIAGTYPALVLSKFNTAEVLKSRVRLGGSNIFTRSLVTFQFVLSAGMIISTFVMLQQLSFMRDKDLGFLKDNVLVVDAGSLDAKTIFPLFKDALQSRPEVLGVSAASIGLGEGAGQMGGGMEFNGITKGVINYPVDEYFLSVMGMQLVAGRNFDIHRPSDTLNAVIVNQQLLKEFEIRPEEAIGQQIRQGKNREGSQAKTIVGVVNDFHFEDLRRYVRPQLFTLAPLAQSSKFFIRLRAGNPGRTIAMLEKTWKGIVPEIPLRYSFLDEDYARFYRSEERWSRISAWAGGMAVFLACFGLFGLAALAAVNRTKEIGIRKTLGASVASIVALVSRDFVKLVLAALLIASPIAWYFMNNWLLDFAYRIDIGWEIFFATAVITTGIALMTVGLQAMKAATASPVKSLRAE